MTAPAVFLSLKVMKALSSEYMQATRLHKPQDFFISMICASHIYTYMNFISMQTGTLL